MSSKHLSLILIIIQVVKSQFGHSIPSYAHTPQLHSTQTAAVQPPQSFFTLTHLLTDPLALLETTLRGAFTPLLNDFEYSWSYCCDGWGCLLLMMVQTHQRMNSLGPYTYGSSHEEQGLSAVQSLYSPQHPSRNSGRSHQGLALRCGSLARGGICQGHSACPRVCHRLCCMREFQHIIFGYKKSADMGHFCISV